MSCKKRSETMEQQRVPVDAKIAQRKVSAWLVRDVGNLFRDCLSIFLSPADLPLLPGPLRWVGCTVLSYPTDCGPGKLRR
jgi:hypothetical protein